MATGTVSLPPRQDGTPSRLRDGVRARLAAVLGIVLIPALIWSIVQAALAYREHVARLGVALRSSAAVISAYEDDLVSQARGTLARLAAVPVIAGMVEPACSTQMAEEFARQRSFRSIARIDAAGVTRCASIPDLVDVSYADRHWFREMRDGTGQFAVSEVIFGRVLQRPTVVIAARVGGAGKDFAGAVAATMDIREFAPSRIDGALVAPSSSIVLVDHGGQPLIEERDGEVDQSLGLPPRARIVEALAQPEQTFIATGLDDISRLYAIALAADGRLAVVIGVPFGDSYDWLQERVVSAILGPTAILLMAVMVIWFAANHLVSRHIRTLSNAARLWSQGRTEVRPMLANPPAELAELGSTFTDMADRIAAREAELQASLAQKEVLLKEIHHRVKNNLQIVSSLLNLRARSIKNTAIREALEEVQTRIKALALVHRSLYEQDGPTSVDIERFLPELCQVIGDGSAPDGSVIEVRAEVVPGRIAADKATPIALLVTECVTNAFRHAFPDGRAGTIVVRLERLAGGGRRLSIVDDGIGSPAEVASGGMGLVLARLLAKQIGGELRISGPPGTTVAVDLPDRDSPL